MPQTSYFYVFFVYSYFDAISERFMGASTFSKLVDNKGGFANNVGKSKKVNIAKPSCVCVCVCVRACVRVGGAILTAGVFLNR